MGECLSDTTCLVLVVSSGLFTLEIQHGRCGEVGHAGGSVFLIKI